MIIRCLLIALCLTIPFSPASAGTITINGQTIETRNGSVIISGNKIYVDGKNVTPDAKEISISVDGDVNRVECDACLTISVTGNVHDIKSTSGDVKIDGDVAGDISTMSGDVVVGGDVAGDLNTMSGDVNR